jgi:drug/metabolite transporter (DMT)-like permease
VSKLIIALYVITTCAALIILKLGADLGAPVSIASGRIALNINWYTGLGILLYGISFILYTYLLTTYDLGYIIPVTASFVYIIIFFASVVIFKEAFTLIKVMGIGLILVGLTLLNLKK